MSYTLIDGVEVHAVKCTPYAAWITLRSRIYANYKLASDDLGEAFKVPMDWSVVLDGAHARARADPEESTRCSIV